MATTASTQVPGGVPKVFPPFNKETFASQLVWLVIAFAVLYLMFEKLLHVVWYPAPFGIL